MSPEYGAGRAAPRGLGEAFLARLLARGAYRRTVYAVLILTAGAALYYRVGMGGSVQVLPWWGGLPSLYFLWLAVRSTDPRCRAAFVSFAVLVAAAFTRVPTAGQARLVGGVEVAACLVLLAALSSLARDEGFREDAVLRSRHPRAETE